MMSSVAIFFTITKRVKTQHAFGARQIVCFIALLIVTSPVVAADSPTRVGFTTFLREGPSLNYPPIDEALSGAEVDVVTCSNGWCKIFYGGAYGYVAQRTLTMASREPPTITNPQCFDAALSAYHGSQTHRFCYSAAKPQ